MIRLNGPCTHCCYIMIRVIRNSTHTGAGPPRHRRQHRVRARADTIPIGHDLGKGVLPKEAEQKESQEGGLRRRRWRSEEEVAQGGSQQASDPVIPQPAHHHATSAHRPPHLDPAAHGPASRRRHSTAAGHATAPRLASSRSPSAAAAPPSHSTRHAHIPSSRPPLQPHTPWWLHLSDRPRPV